MKCINRVTKVFFFFLLLYTITNEHEQGKPSVFIPMKTCSDFYTMINIQNYDVNPRLYRKHQFLDQTVYIWLLKQNGN